MVTDLFYAAEMLADLLHETPYLLPAQLLRFFLPEILIGLLLTYVLCALALELGEGRSKRSLALEALSALRTGLSFVILVYLAQLITNQSQVLMFGYVTTNNYVISLKLLTLISGLFILHNSEEYVKNHSRPLLEYALVLTLALLFMLLLVSTSHLIAAFMTIVGFSLNLYVLILFDAPHTVAREAGVKYFYLSTFSSGLMLYGSFLLFVLFQTAQFSEIAQLLAEAGSVFVKYSQLLNLGLVFLLVGLFFKLSAFPGHLWAAEVYEGSPDPITAFFMLPVKVAVLAFLLQLLTIAFAPASVIWQPLIALSALGSVVWGCFGALVEKKTKRFLAYASINQIGFLLIGLASGSLEGYRSTLVYLLIYAVMNVGFLTIFLSARKSSGDSLLYLTNFRGLGQDHWLLSFSMAMILLSMAGIPPLAGFFGKYYLLLHAQEQGLYGLVIAALMTSLVSTYYYLRIIKIFWFEGKDGMTTVACTPNNSQRGLLFTSEGLLWIFIVFSGLTLDLVPNVGGFLPAHVISSLIR